MGDYWYFMKFGRPLSLVFLLLFITPHTCCCFRRASGDPRAGHQLEREHNQRGRGRILRVQHQIQPLGLQSQLEAQRESDVDKFYDPAELFMRQLFLIHEPPRIQIDENVVG